MSKGGREGHAARSRFPACLGHARMRIALARPRPRPLTSCPPQRSPEDAGRQAGTERGHRSGQRVAVAVALAQGPPRLPPRNYYYPSPTLGEKEEGACAETLQRGCGAVQAASSFRLWGTDPGARACPCPLLSTRRNLSRVEVGDGCRGGDEGGAATQDGE